MARVACLFSVEVYDTVEHPLEGWKKIPFGLSMVAACLERAGHEVRCWVACPATDLDAMAREIVRDFGCEMVAASSVSTQFPLIAHLCEHIKSQSPSMPVLLGGVHASLSPQECISHPDIDAVCVGEGEDVAVAWVDALAGGVQPRGIPGAWIKIPGSTEVDRTLPAPFRNDLDQLPLVNYGFWERWVNPEDRSARVVVGRGCPYSCNYCSNHALRRVQPGRYVRFRSPAHILSEIKMVLGRFPDLPSISLEIETIGASTSWILQLCEDLAAFNAVRKTPIAFRANLAVTTQLVRQQEQLEVLMAAFRKANLRTLHVGLESGSSRIRKEILNRPPYSNADLVQFCQTARRHGINVMLYLMIGVPTETPADAVETSAAARACNPVGIFPSIFYPYPGTRLHGIATDMQLMDPSALGTTAERSRVYLKLNSFPRWRVFLEYVLMQWRIFRGRRGTISIARSMLVQALGLGLTFRARRVRQKLGLRRRPEPLSRTNPAGAAETRSATVA